MIEILRLQVSKGYAGGLDLAAQESQLAQAKAALPPLLKQSAQQHDLIAVLTVNSRRDAGKPVHPGSLTLPERPAAQPALFLVTQRPDVLQAEANLHAASAAIGVAEPTACRISSSPATWAHPRWRSPACSIRARASGAWARR